MLIYNITAKVDWTIVEPWLQWLLTDRIPATMATGCFSHHQFVRLLDIDESDGPTFAIQYYAPSREQYELYLSDFAPAQQRENTVLWGESCLNFGTLMEVVK